MVRVEPLLLSVLASFKDYTTPVPEMEYLDQMLCVALT
jgi:hypothetical protein